VIEQQARTSSSPREGLPERSGGSPERGEADPEVVAHPKRRRFSAEYKVRIVREAERCRGQGEIGALLRREGLYSSHLVAWRRAVRRHGVEGMAKRKRGPAPKPKASAREIQLEREKRKLEKELAQANAVIAFQKKVHELLGIPLKNHELEGDG
jgi:transposase-like protein